MKFDAKNNSNVLNLMAMFVFTVLGQKPFFLQICSENQNCLFKIKLGVYTNLNVLNPMVMFICPVLDWKYNLFWQIWSRKSKLSVQVHTWFILKYAEFDVDVDSFYFGPVVLLLDTFIPKSQTCLFEMEVGTYTKSNMLNLMEVFTFSVLDRKYST